jgi:hypothetical protein
MPIHQINLFICEKCDSHDTSCEETLLYDDPVVKKEGWAYYADMLMCPTCISKMAVDVGDIT